MSDVAVVLVSHDGASWLPAVLDGIRAQTAPVAGVVAVQQTVDTDTGEVLEEPIVLAKHGELPQQFREE